MLMLISTVAIQDYLLMLYIQIETAGLAVHDLIGRPRSRAKKSRGGLTDSRCHFQIQTYSWAQRSCQATGENGWVGVKKEISIGNVCNLLRNQVSR